MKFVIERTIDGAIRFRGEIPDYCFVKLDLDEFDCALLRDVEANGRTAADHLLALEMLFRRYEEQK